MSAPARSGDPAAGPRRLISLDVLRGFAVLLVICNHLDPERLPGMPALHRAAGQLFWLVHQFGWSGVELFFVLSGYLVSGLLFQDLERHGRIRFGRFYGRRAFKILPSYWVLLAVLAVTGATAFTSGPTPLARLGHAAIHVFFLQNYLDPRPNGPTWTLAVEEHFYLCLPLLLAWCWRAEDRGRRVIGLSLAIAALCLALRVLHLVFGHPGPDDFMQTHYRFDSLFFGVLLQHLTRTRSAAIERLSRIPAWLIALAAALLVSPAFFFIRSSPPMFSIGFTALSLGYALLLHLIVRGALHRWELTPPLRAMAAVGRYSYNIYLWQFFVVPLGIPGYRAAQLAISRLRAPSSLIVLAQAALFAGLCIAIGALFTELIELPALRLREKLTGPKPQI